MLLTNPFLYRKTLRLEATPKAISVVPNSARLLHRRRIAAQPAGVILAPSAAGLSRTRVLLAQPVAISLAGTASLKRQLLLKCLPATVSLTTTEAILQRTRLAGFIKAEITIEPQPARLLRNLVLKCQPASIDLTPNSANFLKVLGSIEAQPQTIAIEGRAADLRASRLLTAAPATIGVTPRPAQLLRTYPLSAQPVGLALLPRPAILRMSRLLRAVQQDIAISPKVANLVYTPAFSIVPTDSAALTNVSASHSFANRSIGAAPGPGQTRKVVVFTAANGSSRFTSCLFGVASANLVIDPGVATNPPLAIFELDVPTGTTLTIAPTTNVSKNGCVIFVFAVYNTSGVFASVAANESPDDAVGLSVNVPAGGGVIAGASGTNYTGNTWSGVTKYGTDLDPATGDLATAAYGTTAGTPLAITCTAAGIADAYRGLAVSFSPA